jgi:hypothetical protein
LITTPSNFLISYFKRDSSILGVFEIVDSGYHFSHFYDFNKTVDKLKLINPSLPSHIIENSWNNLVSLPTGKNNEIYSINQNFN